MIQAAIFDLDQTLVDTSSLQQYRDLGLWDEVLQRVGQVGVYPGVVEMMQACRELGIKTAIATSSPRHVCDAIIGHFGLQTDGSVAGSESKFPKPSRDPIVLALQRLGIDRSKAIVIGDRCVDVAAGRLAEVAWTLGATWGAPDLRALVLSKPTYSAANPSEVEQIVHALALDPQHRDWLNRKQEESFEAYKAQMWLDHNHDPRERGYLRGGTFPYFFLSKQTQREMVYKLRQFSGQKPQNERDWEISANVQVRRVPKDGR